MDKFIQKIKNLEAKIDQVVKENTQLKRDADIRDRKINALERTSKKQNSKIIRMNQLIRNIQQKVTSMTSGRK